MANFRDLTDRSAVLSAIEEYDQMGQLHFLKRYGYGKARNFILLHNGKRYDSKAIVGAAYEYQFGAPLTSKEFSGGLATVVPKLAGLGFQVVALDVTDSSVAIPEEVPDAMWEGAKRSVNVNKYERSAEARAACIEAHGCSCVVCGMDFGAVYGDAFHGFIHVHHLVPVSKVGRRYKIDPSKDLAPVCPNCHAVIHYGSKTRALAEVRKLVHDSAKKGSVEK